jgi:probable rRNA maturation factor
MKLQCYLQKATAYSGDLPPRKAFAEWIKATLQTVAAPFKQLELTIRLVDETESAEFNKQYRHKSGPTNILSFPAENLPHIESYYLGDLLICVPLVFQEAEQQGKSSLAHWTHLVVHGTLHLLGYDHIKKNEASKMEALEIEILKQLGYKNPYL